jgi:hypothetical protein
MATTTTYTHRPCNSWSRPLALFVTPAQSSMLIDIDPYIYKPFSVIFKKKTVPTNFCIASAGLVDPGKHMDAA